jgi:formylglycine-generating enzyme required for sulfatase activity
VALRTLLLPALFASACLTPSFAVQRTKDVAPPGTVLIKGGRTKIGTEVKVIQKRILEDPTALQRAGALLSETPRHTVKVDPFFLMVNEVTNEQYEAFVRATGHQPPQSWISPDSQKAAIDGFLAAQGKKREEAKAAGEPIPERKTFELDRWWHANWQQSEWEIPEGTEHKPVVFVNHADSKAYARWAGMRLMTEFEYQRAVRGDSERTYPWGDDFVVDNAATRERPERESEPFLVGSFPGGASEEGVYDLAGNVWEWTDSPYKAFKGYKPLKLKVKKREINVQSSWDVDARVCVSGSIQNSKIAARATARRRLERIQRTQMVGFRCAGTPRLGQDIAITILDEELPTNVRPSDEDGKVQYRPELVLALDKWTLADLGDGESEAKDATATDKTGMPVKATFPKSASTSPPPGYAVIEDYEYIAFIPASEARSANQTSLRKETVATQPLALGVLTTSYPILNPELPAGTYMVSFRGKGERKRRRTDKAAAPDPDADPDAAPAQDEPADDADAEMDDEFAWELELGLDSDVDNFVFYDNAGTPIALLPFQDSDWSYARMNPGKVEIVDIEVVEGEGKEQVITTEQRLNFEVMLEGLTSSKGFRYTLQLNFDQDVLARDWRTQ